MLIVTNISTMMDLYVHVSILSSMYYKFVKRWRFCDLQTAEETVDKMSNTPEYSFYVFLTTSACVLYFRYPPPRVRNVIFL